MKPVYQKREFHAPSIGRYGDCVRACFASLLELPLDRVPDLTKKMNKADSIGAALEIFSEFLAKHNLMPITVPGGALRTFDATAATPFVDDYHLLAGKAKGTGTPHCVVGRNGKVVHDPAPDGNGLEGSLDDWLAILFVRH